MNGKRGIPDRETRKANLVRMLKAKPEWGANRILEFQDGLRRSNTILAKWYRFKWWVRSWFGGEPWE